MQRPAAEAMQQRMTPRGAATSFKVLSLSSMPANYLSGFAHRMQGAQVSIAVSRQCFQR